MFEIKFSTIKYYFWFAIAFYVLWVGIKEFDNATHWIPFFRGLIWMFIGSVGIYLNRETRDD